MTLLRRLHAALFGRPAPKHMGWAMLEDWSAWDEHADPGACPLCRRAYERAKGQ